MQICTCKTHYGNTMPFVCVWCPEHRFVYIFITQHKFLQRNITRNMFCFILYYLRCGRCVRLSVCLYMFVGSLRDDSGYNICRRMAMLYFMLIHQLRRHLYVLKVSKNLSWFYINRLIIKRIFCRWFGGAIEWLKIWGHYSAYSIFCGWIVELISQMSGTWKPHVFPAYQVYSSTYFA